MAVWKKLNPETGEYEPIENAESGGGGIKSMDTEGVADAYTTYPMADVADNISVGGTNSTYTITGLIKGDVVTTKRSFNGEDRIIVDGDGNNLNSKITWKDYVYGTFVLDKDYATLKVQCHNGYESAATVSKRSKDMMNRPAFTGEFIPTITEREITTLKTFSSKKIRADYGMDVEKAKVALLGGVWIALGDSYTVQAGTQFKALAEKYGMIYDGQGKVSSTVCGTNTGSKGFAPFWNRMDGFISNYTGAGQTINDAVYTAEDVKLITVMGGANDGGGVETWVGSLTSKDTSYICGSCNYMFTKMLETFPNATIIVILQPSNYNPTVPTDITDDVAKVIGFANAAEVQACSDYEYAHHLMYNKEKGIKGCAERYGLTIVDCFFNWYSVLNPAHREKYWNDDKIHLNGNGYTAIAEKLDKEGILKIFG